MESDDGPFLVMLFVLLALAIGTQFLPYNEDEIPYGKPTQKLYDGRG